MPRWRISVRGRVQGVGFRPFVASLARELGLAGSVGNDARGVRIAVEGGVEALAAFQRRLAEEPPALARIAALERSEEPERGEAGFAILPSEPAGLPDLAITPDAALCPDCAREILDPADRRHRYPFANCTACGPRYSIILAVPYDRPRTTMAGFPLCPACRREYDDPADRRHHAQPVACPDCGPRLWLEEPGRARTAGDAALGRSADLLHQGRIVALKGLGGFHLACRADDQAVVSRLRERKGREAKPFALLVRDAATAAALVALDPAAARELSGAAAPIVIADRRPGFMVADAVAPGSSRLGVMLPSTPLLRLLMQESPPVLVLTSGNPSGEPLCHDNEEAVRRLAGIADALLLHDRPIARPLDDSVLLAVPDGPVMLRRARGYVPDPVELPISATGTILAGGGDLKSAFCLVQGRSAVLSEHLGDLEHPAALRHFAAAIPRLAGLLGRQPDLAVVDPHPAYHGTRHLRRLGLPLVEVPHHHAHIAACLAEHGEAGPVLGLACDGTGWGGDGSIWGGELLLADAGGCQRLGHLRSFPLPGGDSGARQTWRPALGLLHGLGLLAAWPTITGGRVVEADWRLVAGRLAAGRGAVACSSLGRLFDAVAFLLGAAEENRYEGEAAMRLEALATGHDGPTDPAWVALRQQGEQLVLDTGPLLAWLLARQGDGAPVGSLAAAFHAGICDLLAAGAAVLARRHGLGTVALGGGCFANRILLAGLRRRLEAEGLRLIIPRAIPPGDGGLALGQALVAAARSRT